MRIGTIVAALLALCALDACSQASNSFAPSGATDAHIAAQPTVRRKTVSGGVTILRYPSSTQIYGPIALGSDNRPWFTGSDGVGTYRKNGSFAFYPGPNDGGGFIGVMATAPNGVYVFREYDSSTDLQSSDLLSRVSTNGTVTVSKAVEWYSGPIGSGTLSPAFDSATGLLWLATSNGFYLTAGLAAGGMQGQTLSYALPGPNNSIYTITLAGDAIYGFVFSRPGSAPGASFIDVFSLTNGTVQRQFAVPAADNINAMTAGDDGRIWFIDTNNNAVGRFSKQGGGFIEYPVPTPNANLTSITLGGDGAIWFTESGAGKIGRINASGKIAEYSLGSSSTGPLQIVGVDSVATCDAIRRNHASSVLWFTMPNAIGEVELTGSI